MRFMRLTIFAIALSMTATAHAQPFVVADSGDSAWVLSASIFVLLAALPGLALLHGRGRAGPAGLALFLSAAVVSLLFAIIGYSLAFGEGLPILGGAGKAMLANLANLRGDFTISESLFVLFQLVLAIFSVGILVASISERVRLGWLIAFAGLWSLLVYIPVVRWIWGGGWLAELGARDFGGGIVIQTSAGVAAFVVALLLGRSKETEVAHDSRLALAGVALVWVGWLGVIGGASLAASGDTALTLINAQLAASAAALTGMALERARTGIISVYGATSAAIAGLAAVSAGAGFIAPGGAMAIGVVGALGAALGHALVRTLKLGSAAAAFGTHATAAMAGALAFPVMVLPQFGGPGFEEGFGLTAQLAAQGVAVIAVVLWSAAITAIIALLVALVLPMRTPR